MPEIPVAGKSDRLQILLAACGIAGPILIAIVALVLGLLRPGYDHATQLISELGEVGAPNAVVWNATLFLSGPLLIAFAFGLYRGISGGTWSKVGAASIALWGLSGMVTPFFPCNPGCALDTSGSHYAIGFIGFFPFAFAPLAFWWSLRKNVQWRGFGSYSLATEVMVVPILIAAVAGATNPWDGLTEKVLIGILHLWIAVMALHLLRLSLRPGSQDAPAAR